MSVSFKVAGRCLSPSIVTKLSVAKMRPPWWTHIPLGSSELLSQPRSGTVLFVPLTHFSSWSWPDLDFLRWAILRTLTLSLWHTHKPTSMHVCFHRCVCLSVIYFISGHQTVVRLDLEDRVNIAAQSMEDFFYSKPWQSKCCFFWPSCLPSWIQVLPGMNVKPKNLFLAMHQLKVQTNIILQPHYVTNILTFHFFIFLLYIWKHKKFLKPLFYLHSPSAASVCSHKTWIFVVL